jgi:hypothetical protein
MKNNKMKNKYIKLIMNKFYDYVILNPHIVTPSKAPRIKTNKDGEIIGGQMSKTAKVFEQFIKENTGPVPLPNFPLKCNVLIVIEIQMLSSL